MEAYQIGIRVSLVNAVSAGLRTMIGDFKRADMAALGLQKRIDAAKRSLLVGSLQVGLGVGILAMFKPALDQAKQFQQALTQFSLYRPGDLAFANDAERFAKSMNVAGSTYVQNMKYMTEAQGIFRESGKRTLQEQLEGAKIASPLLAKLAFIQSGLSEDVKASRHAEDLSMLRFIEARGGANDPKTFASIADWAYKLQASSGGVVNWAALQQLAATSGAAGYNLTQDAISKLEPVIADLKGGRTGSGLRVSFQRMLGIQRGLPKQAVAELLSLGLWDRSKVELTAQGGIKRFLGRPGAVLKNMTLFGSDPIDYYTKEYLPAIAKKYGESILGNSAKSRIERAGVEDTMVFGPGSAGAVFSQIDKLMPAIVRSVAAQRQQAGIEQAYAATRKTLAGKQIDFAAQWKNFETVVGIALLPIATRALEALTPPLQWIANFGTAHPRLFGFVVDGLVALAGLSVGVGVINILKGVAGLFSILAPFAGATGVLNVAGMLAKLPVIGAALGDAALDVGIFLGAITLPAWGTIAAIAASIAGGAYILTHYSKLQSPADKQTDREFLDWIGKLTKAAGSFFTGFASPFAAQFKAWLAQIAAAAHPISTLLAAGDKATKAAQASAAQRKDMPKTWGDLGRSWTGGKAPPGSVVPQTPHPAAQKGATVPWTARDYGQFLGTGAAAFLGLNTALDKSKAKVTDLTASHKVLAAAEIDAAKRITAATAALGSPGVTHGASAPQTHIHKITVMVGSREVAKEVVHHVTRMISGPNLGGSNHDPSATYTPVGQTYSPA